MTTAPRLVRQTMTGDRQVDDLSKQVNEALRGVAADIDVARGSISSPSVIGSIQKSYVYGGLSYYMPLNTWTDQFNGQPCSVTANTGSIALVTIYLRIATTVTTGMPYAAAVAATVSGATTIGIDDKYFAQTWLSLATAESTLSRTCIFTGLTEGSNTFSLQMFCGQAGSYTKWVSGEIGVIVV